MYNDVYANIIIHTQVYSIHAHECIQAFRPEVRVNIEHD